MLKEIGKKRQKSANQKVRLKGSIILLSAITLFLIFMLILLPSRDQERKVEENDSILRRVEREILPSGAGARREEHPVKESKLVLVIDDVGYNLKNLETFLEFPGAITFAVLPNLPFSKEAAGLIVEAEKELILHCPMESVNGEDPGPGALLSSQSPDEIVSMLEKNFSFFSGASGMNNHMGSQVTADERVMSVVMSYLQKNNKFFLDSKTTADSVSFEIAQKFGVPVLGRDLFIDNVQGKDYMRQSIIRGVDIAREQGFAVLIGHIYSKEIIDLLTEIIPILEEKGVQLSSLTELIELQ